MLFSLDSGKPVYTADEADINGKNILCFTGHREKSITACAKACGLGRSALVSVKLTLYRYIDMAADYGYDTFISGLASGIDLWAAEYVLLKRRKNSGIRLIGAMPYLRHSQRFCAEDKALLTAVENEADMLISVCGDPEAYFSKTCSGRGSPTLYRDRNYYMVDHSDTVIAFFNKDNFCSGTAQTVNYARRCGKRVVSYDFDKVREIIESTGEDIRKIGREITFIDNPFRSNK